MATRTDLSNIFSPGVAKNTAPPSEMFVEHHFTFTFDSSYPTGGEVVDLSDVFAEIPNVMVETPGTKKAEYVAGATAALGKLLLRDLTDANVVEVSNGTDQSSVVVYCRAYGRGHTN